MVLALQGRLLLLSFKHARWEPGRRKLMVRRRRGRKRTLGTRAPMTLPGAINQRWSLDFVADALSDGRRFRILCVVDDFSRECLATVVDTSLGRGCVWCANWTG